MKRICLLSPFLLLSLARPLSGQVAPLSAFEGISVTTVDRSDTSRLVDGGVGGGEGARGSVERLAGERPANTSAAIAVVKANA
jgi:hypothetical protein